MAVDEEQTCPNEVEGRDKVGSGSEAEMAGLSISNPCLDVAPCSENLRNSLDSREGTTKSMEDLPPISCTEHFRLQITPQDLPGLEETGTWYAPMKGVR